MATTITVSNASELSAALASYQGETTILLKAGQYGALKYSGIGSKGALTLKAADPAQKAVFEDLNLQNATGVTLDGLAFNPKQTSGEANSFGLSLPNSSNIEVVNSAFSGEAGSLAKVLGIRIKDSRGVTIENNTFTDLQYGLQAGNSQDLKILGNTLTGIRADAHQFSDVQGLELARNFATNFNKEPGAHADFVQFHTVGTSQSSENIHIHDNVFLQGSGTAVQGIFMGNEAGLAYKNVTIENNLIYTGHWHGITIGKADGVVIDNNTILGVPNNELGTNNTWIKLSGVTNARVTDNLSNSVDFGATGTNSNNTATHWQSKSGTVPYAEVFSDAGAGASAKLGDFLVKSAYAGKGASLSPLEQAGAGTATAPAKSAPAEPVPAPSEPAPAPTPTEPPATTEPAPTPAPVKSTVAIDTAGKGYTDATGLTYAVDTGTSPYAGLAGSSTVNSTGSAIGNTGDDALYQSYRYGKSFGYDLGLANGTYTVEFQFIEPWATSAGQRVFDVLLEGQEVISNLDLFKAVGKNNAYTVSKTVTVTDGQLNVRLDASGTDDKDNAILSGLVVRPTDGATAPAPTPAPTPAPSTSPVETQPAPNSSLVPTFTGTEARDIFDGTSGNDVIVLKGGSDIVNAGSGNDILVGGLGKDWLCGQAGDDIFVYTSIQDSPTGSGRDVISAWGQGGWNGNDTIDLRQIDANSMLAGDQAFKWLGGSAFTGKAGELRAYFDGTNTIVEGTVNADKIADFQIQISGKVALTMDDFLL